MTSEKVVDMHWREYEYRHKLFWGLLYKLIPAIATLIAVPFVYGVKIAEVRQYALLFPVMALTLSMVGAWLVSAEAARLRPVIENYRNSSKRFTDASGLSDARHDKISGIFSWRITGVVSVGLLIFGVATSFAAMLIIINSK